LQYFSVKNFDKYQHYKKGNPAWIKLYFAVLWDYEFSRLTDAQKLQVLLIWLLASKSNNRLPWDAAWIQREIKSEAAVDLDALKEHGFIEFVGDSRESLEPV
jgi:hypothetical protein